MEIAYYPSTGEIDEAPNQKSAAQLAEQRLSTMEAPADFKASRHEDYKVVDGAVVEKSVTEKLPAIQAAALAEIDRQAEERRLKVATPGEGQATVYMEKRAEAKALQTDASPVPADYPFLAAEIGVTPHPVTGVVATDIAGVAEIILLMAAAWRAYGAAIENIRRTAKFAVETADQTADPAATIQTTLDGLTWPDVPE